MSTGLVRQPAPVRVALDLPLVVGATGDSWPISGITDKLVLVAAAGLWTGTLAVQVSNDGVDYAAVGTVTASSPELYITADASWVRLKANSNVTDDPSATLSGYSVWSEV